jgi:electron transport complex protein RnfC
MSMSMTLPGRFPGGLLLDGHKSLSNQRPIRFAGLPARLILPLRQRNGELANPRVNEGDRVLRGSLIAGGAHSLDPPIHASSSGRVVAIEDHAIPHPSGMSSRCILIETDGLDECLPSLPELDKLNCSLEPLLDRIHEAGIVGLGGAVFPTAAKLLSGEFTLDTLILNGAECEPYISCDDRLMRERAEEVLQGAELLRRCLGCKTTLMAVEADMRPALEALKAAQEHSGLDAIRLIQVPVRYPAGGERQLIQLLTGREVPSGLPPAAIGIICLNVASVAAIYRAATLGKKLDSRIVTITGEGVQTPQNLEVRLGTPINFLIEQCGGYTDQAQRLTVGGPMMGYAVDSDALPITASVNAILVRRAETHTLTRNPQPCIRCGACAEVCPASLLPQQLYWHAQARQLKQALDHHLSDCIECGCCDAVCPSQIPLVREFQQAKQAAFAEQQARSSAAHAKMRFEARQARLLREQQEREIAARQRKASLDQGTSSKIQEALERARQKRALKTKRPTSENPHEDDH